MKLKQQLALAYTWRYTYVWLKHKIDVVHQVVSWNNSWEAYIFMAFSVPEALFLLNWFSSRFLSSQEPSFPSLLCICRYKIQALFSTILHPDTSTQTYTHGSFICSKFIDICLYCRRSRKINGTVKYPWS